MSDYTQQEQQGFDRELQLSNELNALLASRDEGTQADVDPRTDPFGHVYVCLADVIISATRMYMGLRGLENTIGGENASQDTN